MGAHETNGKPASSDSGQPTSETTGALAHAASPGALGTGLGLTGSEHGAGALGGEASEIPIACDEEIAAGRAASTEASLGGTGIAAPAAGLVARSPGVVRPPQPAIARKATTTRAKERAHPGAADISLYE
jgi:hypothetical protein